jgi:hypothetical protein
MKIDPAKQLFREYRFAESVAAYRHQLRDAPDNWANIEGIAHSLMAVGEFAEAIPYLEKVDRYASGLHPGATGRQIELSVCHWMIGERTIARDLIRTLVIAVRDGRIYYTDAAGGVEQGLILCYMSVTSDARSDIDLAMNYLKKLARRSLIRSWPGPAALFLLGGLTFGEMVKDATGFAGLVQAKAEAEKDVLKRRWLVDALFAAGTERRMAGDEAGCHFLMGECAGLTHPKVEYVWYLAQNDVTA